MGQWGPYDHQGDTVDQEVYLHTGDSSYEEWTELIEDLTGEDDPNDPEILLLVPGICLHMLRQFNDNWNMHEWTVPDDFPQDLLDRAILCVKNSMNNVDGWCDNVERLTALEHELYLFTRGQHGQKPTIEFVKEAFKHDFSSNP